MDDWFREPMKAAVLAAGAVIAYVYVKSTMNKEKVANSAYFKPALLVAVLVYIIVSRGTGTRETISTEPY
jgi:hypothetical protein